MSKNSSLINIKLILPVFGLVLLLLMSPCKVRNFIQAELDIPTTEVLNKNKSSISQVNCQSFQTSKAVKTISNPSIGQPNFLSSEITGFEFSISIVQNSFPFNSSIEQLTADIPLYILYQNFKVHT